MKLLKHMLDSDPERGERITLEVQWRDGDAPFEIAAVRRPCGAIAITTRVVGVPVPQ